jgi:undecaprenyl diphosphate synthase
LVVGGVRKIFMENVKKQPSVINHQPPTHVAVIMDGNGRWAKARGLPRTAGHKKGADTIRTIMNACRDSGVRYLTIYAFSSENWKRSDAEVTELMQLLQHYLHQELQTLHENNIRLRFIGDTDMLSADIRIQLDDAAKLTGRNDAFHFTIALSYGARQEMVRAVKKIIAAGTATDAITEELIAQSLDTAQLPEPDLLIRTGGEQRLSNFLLWQSAYTEFYFTDVLWPDFGKKEFAAALENFSQRERRYGTAE